MSRRLTHTGNPALSEKISSEYLVAPREHVATMTVVGTALKTFLLLLFSSSAAAWGWAPATRPIPADFGSGYGNTTVTIPGGFWLASFAAFFLGIIMILTHDVRPCSEVMYAASRGLCLGAISAAFDRKPKAL